MAKRVMQGPAPTKMIDRARQAPNKSVKPILAQPGGK